MMFAADKQGLPNRVELMCAEHDELAERVRQGDAAALAEFLTAKQSALLAYINRQLGTALRRKVEADDILQEVSADAVRSLPGINLSKQDPFGWLCQLAERRTIDAYRRFFGSEKRAAGREVAIQGAKDDTQGGLVNLLIASITSPSQAFSRDQREFRMQAAIGELPDDQQTALRLRYVEGLSSKEVAEQLGKSDGAIRVMLTRSLNKLREQLGE